MKRLPWWLGNSSMTDNALFGGFIFLALWSALWTGLALWHAARRNEKGWFVLFLIVHTAGILEIIYLLFIAKMFAVPPKHVSKIRSKK